MQSVKRFVRKIFPSSWAEGLARLYRRVRGFLAALTYGFPAKKLKIIGVTGTNGKTTTASYISSILETAGFKVAVSSTAYFKIGDKVEINDTNLTADHSFAMQKFLAKAARVKVDYVVLEVTAHGLDQQRGLYGVEYVAAVMTNLTQDHLDYFETMENYAAAKAKLFASSPPLIVLNRDDDWFDYFDDFPASKDKITYGTHPSADTRITHARLGKDGSSFKLNIDKSNEVEMHTQLVGKFNVYNASAAASLAYLMHIDKEHIQDGVALLQQVDGRMQHVEKGQNFSVIVDYAHTPDALKNVLETLKQLTTNRLILVFGATGDRDKDKRPTMGEIAAQLADRIVLTDEEPYTEDPKVIREDVMKGIKKGKGVAKTNEVADRREGIKKAFKIAKKGDTVLITGMGHLNHMTVGPGQKIEWNEVKVSEELLDELKKSK